MLRILSSGIKASVVIRPRLEYGIVTVQLLLPQRAVGAGGGLLLMQSYGFMGGSTALDPASGARTPRRVEVERVTGG